MQTPEPREGLEVNVSCTVEGTPNPEVTWAKDNVSLLSEGNLFISTSSEGVAQVRIYMAARGDSGVYQCNAVNLVGYVNQEFVVNILG